MAFQGFLKQSTAVDILLGPFLDETDGKTAEAGLTISQADVKLSKNGQALAQKADVTACAADGSDGYYNCELDATDTNTVGQLTVVVHESGALPVRLDYHIVEEAVYDAMYGASAAGPLQGNTAQTGDTYALANGASGFANIKSETALIVADTNELQTDDIPGTLSAIVGYLDTEIAAILVDTGTTIPGLIATAQADLDILTGADGVNLLSATQASIDAIEVDTNELQTDWADGGRLDVILDAVSGGGSVTITTEGESLSSD